MASFVFQRYELKYLLTAEQYQKILPIIRQHLKEDAYGETTIQSLYYDTEDNRLIRSSIEKPVYKEKLRLRCYGLNNTDKDVYLEMKRKYDGVVYKRRIACKESEAQSFFTKGCPDTQIGRELTYFLSLYRLLPKMLILYDRTAYLDPGSDLRVTFDRRIRYRTEDLDFRTSLDGEEFFSDGSVLMECKVGSAYPLWLCELMSREKIRKTSFSKYGTAYQNEYQKKNSNIIESRSIVTCLNPFFTTEPLLRQVSSS